MSILKSEKGFFIEIRGICNKKRRLCLDFETILTIDQFKSLCFHKLMDRYPDCADKFIIELFDPQVLYLSF